MISVTSSQTFEIGGADVTSYVGLMREYVLAGKLELRTAEDQHELAEGDAIYFDSTVSHGYRRIGQTHNRAGGGAGTARVTAPRKPKLRRGLTALG